MRAPQPYQMYPEQSEAPLSYEATPASTETTSAPEHYSVDTQAPKQPDYQSEAPQQSLEDATPEYDPTVVEYFTYINEVQHSLANIDALRRNMIEKDAA